MKRKYEKKAKATINYQSQISQQSNYVGWYPGRFSKRWVKDAGAYGLPTLTGTVHQQLLARSQALDQNNSFATQLLDRACEHIVQGGFKLSLKSDDPKWVYDVEAKYEKWLDEADLSGLPFIVHQYLVCRSFLRDGDLAVIYSKDGEHGGLQIIEANRIINPTDVGDRNIVDGIEVDDVKKLVAVHVNVGGLGEVKTKRIQAQYCAFITRLKRASNIRGEGVFSQSAELFDQLDAYLDATVKAARAQANVVYSIETDKEKSGKGFSNLQSNEQGQKLIQTEAGSVFIAPPGSKLNMLKADAVSLNNGQFIMDIQRQLGNSMGMPMELFNVTQTNWSGSKSAQDQAKQAFRTIQNQLIAFYFKPMFKWWINKQIEEGYIAEPSKDFDVEFIRPAFGYNDNTDATKNDLLKLNMGLKTFRQLCNENGLSYEGQLREMQQELDDRELYGLPSMPKSNDCQNEQGQAQDIDALAKAVTDWQAQQSKGAVA